MNAELVVGAATALLLGSTPIGLAPAYDRVSSGPRVAPSGPCCVTLLDLHGYTLGAPYADGFATDEFPNGIVRLRWRPEGRAVKEVKLFLADAQQNVVAVQTLRAAPYTALFRVSYGAPYAGITVVYVDGQHTTTLLPYSPR